MSIQFAPFQFADDADFFQGFWSRMFGGFIESAREKTGRTIEQTAVLAGMSGSEWAGIEAGAHLPNTRRQLQTMAAALDLEWAMIVRIVFLCREAWGLK